MKRLIAVLTTTALMMVAMAAPALAQQTGLVNVDIDVTQNQVIVQVPIGIAANVCPQVNAAVLAQDIAQTGTATCEADADAMAESRAFQKFLNSGAA